MKNWLTQGRFIQRTYILFCVCFIMPMLIVGGYVYYLTAESVKQEKAGNMLADVNKCASLIDSELSASIERSTYLTSNTNLVNKISRNMKNNMEETVRLDMELKMLLGGLEGVSTEEISPITFFLHNNTSYRSRYIDYISNLQLSDEIQKALDSHVSEIVWDKTVYTSPDSGHSYLFYYRNIPNFPENLGIIRGAIPFDKLETLIKNAMDLRGGVFVYFDANGTEVKTFGNRNTLDRQNLNVSQQLTSGHTVSYATSEKSISSALRSLQLYILIMLLLVIVLSGLCGYFVMKQMTQRLNRFIGNLKEKLIGPKEEQTLKGDDITIIEQRFTNILMELDQMHKETWELKIKQDTAEFELLQAKINPHFLYNSLSAIKWEAARTGKDNICVLIDELTRYYRSVFSMSQNVVTLRQEFEMIKNYFDVTKLSYQIEFEVSFEASEDALSCNILKMLLQPIAENAVLHGIQGIADGKITVGATREGEFLNISITDTGYGMIPEKLAEINNGKSTSKHYGLRNIRDRIRLYYGEHCGLTVDSAPGRGTCVTVKIPVNKAEKEILE